MVYLGMETIHPPEFYRQYPMNFPWFKAKGRGKLVVGLGVNDAPYVVRPRIKGKTFRCPAHERWTSMLRRVYSEKSLSRFPSYEEVEVCKEWVESFMAFRTWFFSNLKKTTLTTEDVHVDKDILSDSKLYGPDTCILVPARLNTMLNRIPNIPSDKYIQDKISEIRGMSVPYWLDGDIIKQRLETLFNRKIEKAREQQ